MTDALDKDALTEGIARLVAWPMRVLAMISAPFVHLLAASTNGILKPLLRLLRIHAQDNGPQALSAEELRTIVLESSNILPKKHGAILLNLFELEDITVDDVMVPRSQIETINLAAPIYPKASPRLLPNLLRISFSLDPMIYPLIKRLI